MYAVPYRTVPAEIKPYAFGLFWSKLGLYLSIYYLDEAIVNADVFVRNLDDFPALLNLLLLVVKCCAKYPNL